jgi:hypothetical protein
MVLNVASDIYVARILVANRSIIDLIIIHMSEDLISMCLQESKLLRPSRKQAVTTLWVIQHK